MIREIIKVCKVFVPEPEDVKAGFDYSSCSCTSKCPLLSGVAGNPKER
jgi:hypothetical protein